jgi:hypothetical protein
MNDDARATQTSSRKGTGVLDELPDEDVVGLEPPVREALERVAPRPTGRWRILAWKWFVLIRKTD